MKANVKSVLMKKYCRVYQAGAKLLMAALPWRSPKMLSGSGAVKKLPEAVRDRGFHKVLIVTGPKIRARGLLNELLEEMKEKKLKYVIFDGISQNPTDEEVENGVGIFLGEKCDCMIAFGGGSVMDCAKGIGARVARPKKAVRNLQGLFRVLRPIPVIFAVPTTSGSGSEATIAAVITEVQTHHKASINDLQLMPRFAVLDPCLTVGLPPQVTAQTGMDALCHAVEAYTNDTYNSDFERLMCSKAVRLIHESLLTAYEDGTNLQARQDMLPHVMRAYGSSVYDKLADLCDICAMEVDTPDGMISAEVRAETFLQWMEELKEKLGIPKYPDMIREEDVNQIVKWAQKEANPVYPVPEIWDAQEMKEFVLAMMEGARLEGAEKNE